MKNSIHVDLSPKLVLILLTLASISNGIKYDGLIVKYGCADTAINKDYFFSIPRTVQDAEAEGFNRTESPEGPMAQLQMYCPKGRVVCPLFHPTSGFVAGLQIAAPVRAIDPKLNPEKYFIKWTPPAANGEPAQEFWTATQYYYSPESATGPSKENGSTLQFGGVWVKGLNGQLLKILGTEADISKTIFKKQACVPNMGMHYYYNMTKELPCDLPMLPWFGLVTDGDLLGLGFQTFGGKLPITNKTAERDFFENIPKEPRTVPLRAIPNAPECFLDYSQTYGRLSIHIYYISKPWELRCAVEDMAKTVPVSTTSKPTKASSKKSASASGLTKEIYKLVIALSLIWVAFNEICI